MGWIRATVVVLWHSYNDLPDTFGLVYFGVIPYDRDIDIGVTNLGSNTVSILRNNGDGTFATKVGIDIHLHQDMHCIVIIEVGFWIRILQ